MNVIPVMDLMRGSVVWAEGGRREEYRPLRSILLDSSDPVALAGVFRDVFGFREMYIADLDSIMGSGENLALIGRVAEAFGGEVMVDAGVWDRSCLLYTSPSPRD